MSLIDIPDEDLGVVSAVLNDWLLNRYAGKDTDDYAAVDHTNDSLLAAMAVHTRRIQASTPVAAVEIFSASGAKIAIVMDNERFSDLHDLLVDLRWVADNPGDRTYRDWLVGTLEEYGVKHLVRDMHDAAQLSQAEEKR